MSDPLLEFVPSLQRDVLGQAIGRRLVEIERLIVTGDRPFDFGRAVGPVQLRFDPELLHVLSVLPSQLTLLVERDVLRPDYAAEVYKLSASKARPALHECLGRVCTDVRIWKYRDDVPSDEAREAAISYVLEGGRELFYVIYLHGASDDDALMTADEFTPVDVDSCYSIARGAYL
jgi:hypothetical protein